MGALNKALSALEDIRHKTSEYQKINKLGHNCKKGRTIQNVCEIAETAIAELKAYIDEAAVVVELPNGQGRAVKSLQHMIKGIKDD